MKIDENFTRKKKVNYVLYKIRKLIFKFYEVRKIIVAIKNNKTVYYALTESIINYGMVIYGSAGATTMTNLQLPQKWIIKIMLLTKKNLSHIFTIQRK